MKADKSTPRTGPAKRPLSPHLQVYRPQITSVLSILHRMMGVALAGGALLLAYWLSAAAYGPDSFQRAQALFGSIYGQGILLCLTVALFYHLNNGIRHLFWDVGLGLELTTLRVSGVVTVIATLIMTAAVWGMVL